MAEYSVSFASKHEPRAKQRRRCVKMAIFESFSGLTGTQRLFEMEG